MARLLGLSKVPVFAEEGDAKITSEFGESIKDYPMEGQTGRHTALDLVRCTDGRTSEPATITAMADGVIIAQRKWVKGFRAENATAGNCVHIRHNNGMVSKYFHLEYGSMPDWIKDGAPVKKNDVLSAYIFIFRWKTKTAYALIRNLICSVSNRSIPSRRLRLSVTGLRSDAFSTATRKQTKLQTV